MAAGKSYPLSLILTAIDRVSRPLQRVHNAIERLTAPIKPVQNALTSLSNTSGLARLRGDLGGVKDSLSDVGTAAQTSFRRVTYIVGAATAAAYLFNRQFIGTASTFENLSMQLEGLEGNAERAKAAMAFIKQMAVATPFETEDIAKTFTVMRGFGMDPTNGTLQAIVDQVARLGGGGEKLTGIALQLGQAFSKGRLQAQDANILVENSVPVWGLLQRAMARVNKGQQVSIGQLREWSEKGQLGTKAIALLIEQMGIESKGASDRMMTSWSGMISRLHDAWTFFKLKVMESGPFEALKARLSGVLERINEMAKSGELDRIAEQFAARLMKVIDWFGENIPKAWALLQELGGWVKWIADLCGGWDKLVLVSLAAFIGGPLAVAIAGLIASIVTLGVTIGLTPVGWFLGALAAIGAAAFVVVKYWDPVSRWFKDIFTGWKTAMSGLIDFLAGIFTMDLGRILRGLGNMFKGAAEFWLTILRPVFSALGWLADQVLPSDTPGRGAGAMPRVLPENLRTLGVGQNNAQARVSVDFTNVPRGTRIVADPKSTALLELSRGFSMMESH